MFRADLLSNVRRLCDYVDNVEIALFESDAISPLPDGTAIRPPMDPKLMGAMTDVELKAVWAFLRTLPPRATGER